MPTLSQMATVSLEGFDKQSSEYRDVHAASPVQHRVALVHAALRAHAVSRGFQALRQRGHDGYLGRASIKNVVRELFSGEVDDDSMPAFTKAVQAAAEKAGLLAVVEKADQGGDPILWVADSYRAVTGHEPLSPETGGEQQKKPRGVKVYGAKAGGKTRGRKRERRPSQQSTDRMYQVKAVLDSVGGAFDTAMTYSEILEELRAGGAARINYGKVVTSVDLLVSQGQAVTRQMSEADKAAIKAAGDRAPSGIAPVLVMLTKHTKGGQIPTLLGSLAQLKGTGAPVAAPTPPVEPPFSPEARKPAQAETAGPESDVPAEVLDGIIRDTMAMPEQDVRQALILAQARILGLGDKVAKLERARDGLIAAIDTMKG